MKLNTQKIAGIFLGVIGLIVPFFLNIEGLSEAGHVALGIFFLAAAFWMLEPVPIYATSIFVIFLQVLLLSKEGILFSKITADYTPDGYESFIGTLANPIIILFLGGFVLASGAVKFNLDKTLTRFLLKPFGTKPKYIVLGLMSVTALLSAFMSNTATTAMMMTVIIPIIARTETDDPLRIGIALCIPFAANIGGIATPIGTPPNAVVLGALSNQGISIPFGQWMLLATPLVIVMLLFAWFFIMTFFKPKADQLSIEISDKVDASSSAIFLYVVFAITVLLWVTESFHGIKSGVIALIPVAALSLTNILSKEDIRKLPWEVLWLVAGGISLGISMKNTGLAEWIVGSIAWANFGPIALILLFGAVTWLMANFLSHTVTSTLIIPLAISISVSGIAGVGFNLIIISLVIGISSSMAMILPISTPPNAIAISTGFLETKNMFKTGLTIGVIGLSIVTVYALFYWPLILN